MAFNFGTVGEMEDSASATEVIVEVPEKTGNGTILGSSYTTPVYLSIGTEARILQSCVQHSSQEPEYESSPSIYQQMNVLLNIFLAGPGGARL